MAEIRDLRPGDRPAWQPLWDAYLRFYRAELEADVTDDVFSRLSAGRSDMVGLVAQDGDELIGFAHLILHPSTWTKARYTYLEDLYVAPGARGGGTARALIEATYARADELGAPDVYWHTQEFNAPARSLYDQVARRTSFIVYER